MVLSRITFSSLSTVALIQQCHKFSCIICFNSHISFNSPYNIQQCNTFNSIISFTLYLIQQFHIFNGATKSMVFLVLYSHLFQQTRLSNSVTNSVLLSNFTVSSYSKSHAFNCVTSSVALSTVTVISHSTVPTIFNNVTNSIV